MPLNEIISGSSRVGHKIIANIYFVFMLQYFMELFSWELFSLIGSPFSGSPTQIHQFFQALFNISLSPVLPLSSTHSGIYRGDYTALTGAWRRRCGGGAELRRIWVKCDLRKWVEEGILGAGSRAGGDRSNNKHKALIWTELKECKSQTATWTGKGKFSKGSKAGADREGL